MTEEEKKSPRIYRSRENVMKLDELSKGLK